MNKQTQVNKVANKITKKIKKVINKRRIKRGRRNVLRRRRRMKRGRMIGAAYARNFRKEMQILNKSGSSMVVRGRDLIYSIPDEIVDSSGSSIMTVIPSNPAYWTGTRVSAIASGYQNFKPRKFIVTYVPQCAVTQQGVVIGGTLWAMAPKAENLQQTLKTSNGGMMTQCYKTAKSRIALKNNLQFKLFRMGGKFDQESNPFIFIAMSVATYSGENRIIPGYFYVSYEYEFINPIGNTLNYFNSSMISKDDFNEGLYRNVSAVNCSSPNVMIGALLQDDSGVYTYNDDPVTIEDDAKLWYFCNDQISSGRSNIPLYYTGDPIEKQEGNTFTVEAGEWYYVEQGITVYAIQNIGDVPQTFIIENTVTMYNVSSAINQQVLEEHFEFVTVIASNLLNLAYQVAYAKPTLIQLNTKIKDKIKIKDNKEGEEENSIHELEITALPKEDKEEEDDKVKINNSSKIKNNNMNIVNKRK